MKVQWTSVTPAVAQVTLGDDSVKWATDLEELGGPSVEQVEDLFFSPAAARFARGNVKGDCIFTAAKSWSTIDAAAAFFNGEFGRLNQQGTLLLTFESGTLTMTNAVLRGVRRIQSQQGKGVRWVIRYTFGITTITNP